MNPCPHCQDSLGHPGLVECPETGRPLPVGTDRPDDGPAAPTSCPHCRHPTGHPGFEYCPETGSRMPQEPSTPVAVQPPPDGALPESGSNSRSGPAPAGGAGQRSRDPHAAYVKAWLLEVAGAHPVGLDDGDTIVLGRNPDSPFGSWCDDNISRRHVEMSVRDGRLFAEDLGSINGTYLNGERLAPRVATPCRDGDVLQLASEEPVRIEIRQ